MPKTKKQLPHFLDPYNLSDTYSKFFLSLSQNPQKLLEKQFELWQDFSDLWQGHKIIETPKDKRFKDEMWDATPYFDLVKQSYFLTQKWVEDLVQHTEGLDEHTQHKLNFFTKQFLDACAPTNFLLTNPEVLRITIDTKGENLIQGYQNFLKDLQENPGQFLVSMTDKNAFKVGENIANTKGKVIYKNDLMELIAYYPSGSEIYHRPVLIIPPWINKYYILDLKPENSMVKWLLDQGHAVFMISWVNPRADLAHKRFDDYMLEGPLAALDAITSLVGHDEINAVGYCLGGTLLASTMAYMAAHQDFRIKSASYLTTLVDFSETGDLSVFIDEAQIDSVEAFMDEKGYFDGALMATNFNMLRSNDLIWNNVINNYLLGKHPFPFDLLYWNSDTTRLPPAMYRFYLRECYLKNKLVKPGAISLNHTPINLALNKSPVFMMATCDDHIVPWRTSYKATQIYQGPVTFVLAGSGHIAGVVNPPAAHKYQYWTNNSCPSSAIEWQSKATAHPGSWWESWHTWMIQQDARKIKAFKLDDALPAAPGTYVFERA